MVEKLIQKLKQYKEQTNKTNRELAEAIGVTEVTILEWFGGNRVPNSRPTIQAIEKYLEDNK